MIFSHVLMNFADFFCKLIKFGVVGFSGLIVDFSVTYILKDKLAVQKYVSNAAGFVIAASTNYVLNRIWTFDSHNPEIGIEYTKFFVISAIGLGINSLVLWFLVGKLKKHFYVSKLFAIAITTFWNFFANLLYTFA